MGEDGRVGLEPTKQVAAKTPAPPPRTHTLRVFSKIMTFIYVWISEEIGKGFECYVLHAGMF